MRQVLVIDNRDLTMVEALLANIDQNKIDLAISGMELAKEAVPPTIELIKGHLKKKSTKVQLTASAVFTFYGSIAVEDYHGLFVKKITSTKIDKGKLKLGAINVSYSIRPHTVSFLPIGIVDYGESIFDKEKEMSSLYNRIDQIRLFVFPVTEKMELGDLTTFISEFDNLLEENEAALRAEGKIPLKTIAKHIVFDTSDLSLLKKCSDMVADSVSIHCSKTKIMITYSKIDKMLDLMRVLW